MIKQQEIPKSINVNGKELHEMIVKAHDIMMLDKAIDLLQVYLERHKENKIEFPYDDDLFHEIQTFHKESLFCYQQLQDNKNWTPHTDNQYFKMCYKFIENSPNVALKFESTMKVPLVNACALIYQTELFNQWVPFCKISKNLKQIRLGHKICYVMLNVPVLSNREAYIRGYGVDKLDSNKSFLICCQTIHHDTQYKQKYGINIEEGKNVQTDVQFFTLEVTPVTPGEFIMKCVCSLDPKLKFMPQGVLNFLIKQVGKFMYERFVRQAQNIQGSGWEKAMSEEGNKEFYEHILRRVDQYFSKY